MASLIFHPTKPGDHVSDIHSQVFSAGFHLVAIACTVGMMADEGATREQMLEYTFSRVLLASQALFPDGGLQGLGEIVDFAKSLGYTCDLTKEVVQ